MSTLQTPSNAVAFVKSADFNSWQPPAHVFPSSFRSNSYVFDPVAHGNASQRAKVTERYMSPLKNVLEIYPADRTFVLAAREAIVERFKAAADAKICVKASMQFRVFGPSGKLKLVHHVLTPCNGNGLINVVETDLTHVATNPVKSVRFLNADEETHISTLELEGFASELGECPYSHRQLQILRLLAEGKTTVEMSESLFISADTVRTHRQHILQRSDNNNMTATVVDCVRKGWI